MTEERSQINEEIGSDDLLAQVTRPKQVREMIDEEETRLATEAERVRAVPPATDEPGEQYKERPAPEEDPTE